MKRNTEEGEGEEGEAWGVGGGVCDSLGIKVSTERSVLRVNRDRKPETSTWSPPPLHPPAADLWVSSLRHSEQSSEAGKTADIREGDTKGRVQLREETDRQRSADTRQAGKQTESVTSWTGEPHLRFFFLLWLLVWICSSVDAGLRMRRFKLYPPPPHNLLLQYNPHPGFQLTEENVSKRTVCLVERFYWDVRSLKSFWLVEQEEARPSPQRHWETARQDRVKLKLLDLLGWIKMLWGHWFNSFIVCWGKFAALFASETGRSEVRGWRSAFGCGVCVWASVAEWMRTLKECN